MDFSWSERQLALHHRLRDFAERELNDDVAGRERDQRFSLPAWRRCADEGVLGSPSRQRTAASAWTP